MVKEINIVPLKVEAKKMANNSSLSLDIPKDIEKKYGIISRGKKAIVSVEESDDVIKIIYEFNEKEE